MNIKDIWTSLKARKLSLKTTTIVIVLTAALGIFGFEIAPELVQAIAELLNSFMDSGEMDAVSSLEVTAPAIT